MTSSLDGYRPIHLIGRALASLLGLGLIFELLAVTVDVGQLSIIRRAQQGRVLTFAEVDENQSMLVTIGTVRLALVVLTGILFIWWFSRAYRNLASLGVYGLRYARGWAIGAWFVPILNLFRPKQIADDIWRASNPELPPEAGALWQAGTVTPWVHAWWAAGLISGALNRFAISSLDGISDLDDAGRGAQALLVSDVVGAIFTLLAIVVVFRMSHRQTKRAQMLRSVARNTEVTST